MRFLLTILVSAGFCHCLSGQANRPSEVPGSTFEIIKNEFRYTPTIPAGVEKEKKLDSGGDIVKMNPFHVYISKNPPPSAATKKRGTNGIDLNAERHIWSGKIGGLPAEIGLLKHEDILPFGASTPRWDIFRLKW
jgi:hypothetical protein